MGQAKRRGTFEQRRVAAIERVMARRRSAETLHRSPAVVLAAPNPVSSRMLRAAATLAIGLSVNLRNK